MRTAFALIGVLGLLLAALAVFLGVRKLRQLDTWPRVAATVTKVELKFPRGSATSYQEDYQLLVSLAYDQGGQRYTPTVNVQRGASYAALAALADTLRAPGTHEVLVDPQRPGEAIVAPKLGFDAFWPSAVCGVLAIIALWTAAFGFWPLAAARLLLYALIVAFAGGVVMAWRTTSAERRWPLVKADIDLVDVVYQHTVSNQGTSTSTAWQYAPLPWVSFDAGGVRRGTPVEPSAWYSGNAGEATARQQADELVKQGTMDVRYNPENPYEIASPGGGRGSIVLFVVLLLVALGVEVLIRALAHRYHFVKTGESAFDLKLMRRP